MKKVPPISQHRSYLFMLTCIIFLAITILIMASCAPETDDLLFTNEDLYELGMTEQSVVYICPTRGGMGYLTIECAATELQNFVRLVRGLTQTAPATDIAENILLSSYRTLQFNGASLDGYVAADIDGKAYVRRPDGIVYALPYDEYEFMLDLCGVVRPYPEDLDHREILPALNDKSHVKRHDNNQPEPGTVTPQNVNFIIPSYLTVDNFSVIDACPYNISDITPPDGEYIVVIPCGYYYEMQMGIVSDSEEKWKVIDVKYARSGIHQMSYSPDGNLCLVVFGPVITDIAGWGVHKLDRVELFDAKTGEVLWETDGLCVIGNISWNSDGRYVAFSHETGRAQNGVVQSMLLDTADRKAITLSPPDGKQDTNVGVGEWISNTELTVGCSAKGQQDSQMFIYDTQSGEMTDGH